MSVGIDIIEIDRLKKALERTPNLLNKLFTKIEIEKSNTLKNKYQFLAGRFAAKEALKKAISHNINFCDIEIQNENDGKPVYYIKNIKKENIKLSISHEIHYAVAIALNFEMEEIN